MRQNYVGLNNLKVGRIAAHMIATAVHRPGKTAVFVGGYRWHGHELRETGFRSYFREYAPQFTVLDTLVNLETRQLTYEATLDLLSRHPDLRGIYCAGGGMEGAIAALREARAPGEVTLVVNEITPESRSALADRYVDHGHRDAAASGCAGTWSGSWSRPCETGRLAASRPALPAAGPVSARIRLNEGIPSFLASNPLME